MRMKNRHYQQVKLNKEALSVGEEEGSSVQREENRTSRKSIDLNSQNRRVYFEASISYDQARFGLIWEQRQNARKWKHALVRGKLGFRSQQGSDRFP